MKRKSDPTAYSIASRERIGILIAELCNGSQQRFAEKTGLNKASVSQYMNGSNVPSTTASEKIGTAFRVNPAWVMGFDVPRYPSISTSPPTMPPADGIWIPVYGHVAAGRPIEAVEDILGQVHIPDDLAREGEFYGLRIHGNSMEPKISDGDIVIVQKQDYADDGDIVIALVNDTETVCKRLQRYHDGISLVSINPTYSPMFFPSVEPDAVKVIGRVREVRSRM